jgi:hypothetical protein
MRILKLKKEYAENKIFVCPTPIHELDKQNRNEKGFLNTNFATLYSARAHSSRRHLSSD